jgi:hypothetical protein
MNHELTLNHGQSIPFEKMRSFELLDRDPVSAAVVVTLLDGRVINGRFNTGCDVFGYNNLGRYSTTLQDLKRVELRR